MTTMVAISIHGVKADDLRVVAKRSGNVKSQSHWIDLKIGDHEITLFVRTEEDFVELCDRLRVACPDLPDVLGDLPSDASFAS